MYGGISRGAARCTGSAVACLARCGVVMFRETRDPNAWPRRALLAKSLEKYDQSNLWMKFDVVFA